MPHFLQSKGHGKTEGELGQVPKQDAARIKNGPILLTPNEKNIAKEAGGQWDGTNTNLPKPGLG